jgi:PPM family protein phosphatase
MANLRVGATTHTGQVRPANEDSLLVTPTVFVVADGMGGHEAGEVASQIAVERIAELLGGDALPSAETVVQAIRTANGDIFRAAIATPGQAGMGTTVTAIAVIGDHYAGRAEPNIDVDDPVAHSASRPEPTDRPDTADEGPADRDENNGDQDNGDQDKSNENNGDQSNGDSDDVGTPALPGDVTPIVPAEPSEALVLANVGDSRTYLFRHGRLRRVTVDHSYVQELVSTGHLSEAEARTHPRRNIITRALGIEPEVKVDWWTLPLIRGDRFVLCSDGLVDEVDDDDITVTLTSESDPQDAADMLVKLANDAGGRDNITVIVVDVLEGDDPPDPTQELDVVPLWADGGADPTPAGTLELDADPSSTADPDADDAAAPRRSNLKRFAIGFGVAAAIVVTFVVFSAWARSGYFVAFDDADQAIIYQGRPGGVLWIEPTAVNEGGPARSDLEPDIATEIDDEPTFDSADAAAEFIRDGVTTTTSTTTTTTTVVPTTTIAPDTTAATGAPTGVTTTATP